MKKKYQDIFDLFLLEQPNRGQLEKDFEDYFKVENKIPNLTVYKNNVVTVPDNKPINYINWTGMIHAKLNENIIIKKRNDHKKVEINPIFSNENVDIYETNKEEDCIKLGKGYDFCISKLDSNMWQYYRDYMESHFYFVFDKTRKDDDPYHLVVVDMNKRGIDLVNANNKEFGDDFEYFNHSGYTYFNYLKKELLVDTNIFKNKPKTKKEKLEEEKFNKNIYSLKYFKSLPIEFVYNYIKRGNALTDEQFDYIFEVKELVVLYLKNNYLSEYKIKKVFEKENYKKIYLDHIDRIGFMNFSSDIEWKYIYEHKVKTGKTKNKHLLLFNCKNREQVEKVIRENENINLYLFLNNFIDLKRSDEEDDYLFYICFDVFMENFETNKHYDDFISILSKCSESKFCCNIFNYIINHEKFDKLKINYNNFKFLSFYNLDKLKIVFNKFPESSNNKDFVFSVASKCLSFDIIKYVFDVYDKEEIFENLIFDDIVLHFVYEYDKEAIKFIYKLGVLSNFIKEDVLKSFILNCLYDCKFKIKEVCKIVEFLIKNSSIKSIPESIILHLFKIDEVSFRKRNSLNKEILNILIKDNKLEINEISLGKGLYEIFKNNNVEMLKCVLHHYKDRIILHEDLIKVATENNNLEILEMVGSLNKEE